MYETYLFILSEKKIMLFMVSIFCINCNNYVIHMNLKTLNLQAQVHVLMWHSNCNKVGIGLQSPKGPDHSPVT